MPFLKWRRIQNNSIDALQLSSQFYWANPSIHLNLVYSSYSKNKGKKENQVKNHITKKLGWGKREYSILSNYFGNHICKLLAYRMINKTLSSLLLIPVTFSHVSVFWLFNLDHDLNQARSVSESVFYGT